MSAAASRRPTRAWSRRRSRLISRSSTPASRRFRSAIRPNCGASRAGRSAPNMRASSCASKSAAATSSTSTTAPMAPCSTRRTSAGATRSACCARANRVSRPAEFSFYGPTCDDLDRMAGPFELPADVGPGDYIEIGMLGAYGCAMRTQFQRLRRGQHRDRRGRADGEPLRRRRQAQALERREAVASAEAIEVPADAGIQLSFASQRE